MFRTLLKKIFVHERSHHSKDDSENFDKILNQGQQILNSNDDPSTLNEIEGRIRSEFHLHYRWSAKSGNIPKATRDEIKAVQEMPALAQVFMFHGDGRVREEAIRNLVGPLQYPASVYALFWRLNDWVPEVRSLSHKALKRVMPTTSATVVVPALYAVLPHLNSWGRWSSEGPKAIGEILGRPDISTWFLEDLKRKRQPNLGQIFRELSRNPVIDEHIECVFETALLPHIRTMALDMLLSERAYWLTGKSKRVWIDRSMGEYRTEAIFDQREISTTVVPIDMVAVGAQDRSAMVRRRSADGLIALRNDPDLRDELVEIATNLRNDPNIGVRNRIDFFFRNLPTA